MGLSGPRKRTKVSHDPNNIHWSRSESKYGQRILQAQGWRPGEYLGAKDASHAKYHTSANLSHIKVSVREDNLGLGARVGAAGGEWETTGLGGFEDLLGRLNGKSEAELGRVRKSREILKRSVYAEKRWGLLRFVSGGLLVGDKIEEFQKKDAIKEPELVEVAIGLDSVAPLTTEQKPQDTENPKKVSKKKSKKPGKAKAPNQKMPLEDLAVLDPVPALQVDDEVRRKADKAERKLQRRLRRAARLEPEIHPPVRNAALSSSAQNSNVTVETAGKGTAFGQSSNGIQALRHRHIKHKKMAMMNAKALNEILMIKT